MRDVAQVGERRCDATPVAELAPDREAFLVKCARGRVVSLVAGHAAQVVERNRNMTTIADLAIEREARLVEAPRRRIVAALAREESQVVERRGHSLPISQLPANRETFLVQRFRAGKVSLLVRDAPEIAERGRDAFAVADLAAKREALLVRCSRGDVVALLAREDAGAALRARPGGGRSVGRGREHGGVPVPPFGRIAAHRPEPPERPGEQEAAHRITVSGRGPRQRQTQIVVLLFEAVEPCLLIGAGKMRPGLLGDAREIGEMPVAPAASVGVRLLLLRILAHGLEHPEAARAARLLDLHEALVGERGHEVERLPLFDALAAADLDGGDHRRAPGEDGEPAEERALVFVEEVVAPVDQRAQRLVPRQRGARASGEKPQSLVEAPADFLDGHRAHACRSEFDRERDAVELRADRRERRRVVRGHREVRNARLSPFDEEPRRVVLRKTLRCRVAPWIGQRQ